MVKRKLRKSAPSPTANSSPRITTISKDATLHRGRKKRLETKQRLQNKKAFIQQELARLEAEAAQKRKELRTRASTQKHGPALAVMSGLQDALDDADASGGSSDDAPRDRKPRVVGHKMRRRILADETVQVNNVRAHPVFVQNPVEALRQHLINTVSADPSEIPPPLAPGSAGASRKRAKAAVEGDGGAKVRVEKLAKVGLKLDKARDAAKERVREKVAEKKKLAEAAATLKKKRGGGKITKQRFGGVSSRGRIGVKRPKI